MTPNEIAEAAKAKLADDPETYAMGQIMWVGIQEAIAAHVKTLPMKWKAYEREVRERRARLAMLTAILNNEDMGAAVAAALKAAEIPE